MHEQQKLWESKKIMAFVAILIIFIVIVMLMKTLKPESPKPEKTKSLPLVETQSVSPKPNKPFFTAIGQVRVNEFTALSAKAAGQVKIILAKEGMAFQKGDPLLVLDDSDFERTMRQSQLQYDQQLALINQETAQHEANLKLLTKEQQLSNLANKSVKRYRDLVKKKLATEAQLDQARDAAFRQSSLVIQRQTSIDNWPQRQIQLNAQSESLKAQLEQTQANAETLTLKAPFDGQVAKLLTAQGANVSPLAPLMHIYAKEDLFIQANIPGDAYKSLMDKAKRSAVKAHAEYLGKTHDFSFSHIQESQSVMGARTGYFKPSHATYLPLNTTLSLNVILPPMENTLAVKTSAVHRQEYIYLVDNENNLKRQAIQLIGRTLVDGKPYSLITLPNLESKASTALQVVTTQMVSDVNGMPVQVASDKVGQ